MFRQERILELKVANFASDHPERKIFKTRTETNRKAKKEMEETVGLGTITKEWLSSSSMHGLKYIADEKRHWIERILWIFLFGCSLSLTVYLTIKMWQKWDESPVYTALDSTSYPVRDLPFSGVTICNVNKVVRSRLLTWLGKNNWNDVEEGTLRDIAQLIIAVASPREMSNAEVRKHENTMLKFNLTGEDVLLLMREVAQPCEDMVQVCTWQGNTSCVELFHLWPTDSGYCCAFNTYDPVERMKPLASHRNENTSSWRVMGTSEGVSNGLTLHLQPNVSEYIVTTSGYVGFQVQVHHPEDIAEPEEKGFPVSESTEAFAAISAYHVSATNKISSIPPSERMCSIFDNNEEHTLNYFTNYSLVNCFAESMTMNVKEACNCVPYTFAFEQGPRTCNISQYRCLLDVMLDTSRGDEIAEKCLPTCEDTFFNVDVTYGPIAEAFFQPNKRPPSRRSNVMPPNVVILHLFHQSRFGINYITDELFGISDFVAASGGNFGLGFGFSLLSAAEIVYFFTIRWFFLNWRRFFSRNSKTVSHYDPSVKQTHLAVVNLDFNTNIC